MRKKFPFNQKVNKYSIRKVSVGVASFIIGSTFLLGLSSEAQADELNDSLSGTEVEQPVNTDKESGEAVATNEQPVNTDKESGEAVATNEQPVNTDKESGEAVATNEQPVN
ncbi:YSIRK-type signal peptide-containing protein, partial [Staphylococcus hyicus]